MGRFAKDTGGGDFEQAPQGTHVARCIRLVDLGTQHGEYEGKATVRNQIIITFELCEEHMADGKPFTVGEFYTNSLGEKAKLRAHLEAWRGRAFTDEELKGFDLESILGKPVMVSLIANQKGRTKIGSLTSMPKGMTASKCVNEPFSFWIEEWDQEKFDAMPEGIRKIIAESDEYKARNGNGARLATAMKGIQDMDQDIPF